MPKIDDTVFDAALNDVKNAVTKLTVLSAEPASFTEANSTLVLASATIASTDFTVGDDETSGRKAVVAALSGLSVTAGGTPAAVALLDMTNSIVKAVGAATGSALTSGQTASVGSFKIRFADPT